MKNTIGFSTKLLILNGLAIFAVPVNHASAWIFISMGRTGYQMGPLMYYGLRIIEQAITFAIPAFLFISGYFVSFAIGRIEANKQWKVIFARVKNLAIPFFVWSVLILILNMLQGNPYSVGSFLLTIVTGNASVPYYFVPLLVQFFILSPFLVSFAKTRYELLLFLTALIQLVTIGLRYDTLLGLHIPALQPILFLDHPHLFPSRIFYFTLGIVFSSHFSQFKQKLIQVRWGLLISLVVFFILGIVEWEFLQGFSTIYFIGQTDTVIDVFYSMALILCFLAFESFAPPFSKQLEFLGGLSFGIYLLHFSVQEYISKIVVHFLPWFTSLPILMYPLLVVCGLWFPIILMTLVNKSPIRRYYRYLFG